MCGTALVRWECWNNWQFLCYQTRFERVNVPVLHISGIEPGQIYHYSTNCWNTAQTFKAGHRIGMEIISSAFPKFDRHLNTGAPLGKTTEMEGAFQHIYHDEEHPSAMIFPLIPSAAEADEAYEVSTREQ